MREKTEKFMLRINLTISVILLICCLIINNKLKSVNQVLNEIVKHTKPEIVNIVPEKILLEAPD